MIVRIKHLKATRHLGTLAAVVAGLVCRIVPGQHLLVLRAAAHQVWPGPPCIFPRSPAERRSQRSNSEATRRKETGNRVSTPPEILLRKISNVATISRLVPGPANYSLWATLSPGPAVQVQFYGHAARLICWHIVWFRDCFVPAHG